MTATITPTYIDINGTLQIVLDKISRASGGLSSEYTFGSSEGDGTPVTSEYMVRLYETIDRYCDLPMGQVTNQPTWTDDLAGVQNCIDDLDAR